MITSAITNHVGVFLTNVAVIQDSSDGLTKSISGSNKMQASLTTLISQIPGSITSTVTTFKSDATAAILTSFMGYSTNAKAMIALYNSFTSKLQSSYSDTTVGKISKQNI